MLSLGLILIKRVSTPLKKTTPFLKKIKRSLSQRDIREFTGAELSELYPKDSIKTSRWVRPNANLFLAHTRKK